MFSQAYFSFHLQELYADAEKVDFAMLSVPEVETQLKVCSGYLEPSGPGAESTTAKRGDFHRGYVDIFPGLFHLTKEGSITPTAKVVLRI
eukprot:SAG31_NODE_9813_length_1224_cov_0.820444_2_plen_90_part_00